MIPGYGLGFFIFFCESDFFTINKSIIDSELVKTLEVTGPCKTPVQIGSSHCDIRSYKYLFVDLAKKISSSYTNTHNPKFLNPA
jgi:hypothetical protein